ncbi:MAG TPA: GNAT family N-acetyltransferase [Blastococcus sp.]|jgi:RimJ/RimL family protein N-acetyltransferase
MTLDLSAVDLRTEVVGTERLVLRPFRPADVDAVHRASQDPETQRWISGITVPYTREDARTFVEDVATREREDRLGLSVAIEARGELVGTGGVYLRGGRLGPEIGYTIAPWARRQGYAAEAAHGLADWGLGLGAPRVHLFVDVRNTASQATAVRAGFTAEGTVRACLEYRDGSRGDAVLFGRLAGD